MKQYLERKWCSYRIGNVCLLKPGVLIVEFEDMDARSKVLDAGSWYFDNKPLIVKALSKDVSLEQEAIAIVPIWIKFQD